RTRRPAHKAKLVQSWLKKNVPNFWDFNTCPPTAPNFNQCDYNCREVGEEGVRHTPQQCGALTASIQSEMNKLDPA
ncbi:Uncharacterized protein FKW44_021224, partial [Caligus rogercresseyi]